MKGIAILIGAGIGYYNIEDLSGNPNPLQIVFPGVKLYKIIGRAGKQ